MMGMWDRAAPLSPVTGSGPDFFSAMLKYQARQERVAKRGMWRKNGNTAWKKHDGTHIDPDWYIIDYGQGEDDVYNRDH